MINPINKREAENWPKTGSEPVTPSPSAAARDLSEKDKELLRIALILRQKQAAAKKAGETPETVKTETETKPSESSNETKASAEQAADIRRGLGMIPAVMLSIAITWLKIRKYRLQQVEAYQSEAESSRAVLDPATAERFARAETAVERRMYRALGALFAARGGNGLKLLPPKETT